MNTLPLFETIPAEPPPTRQALRDRTLHHVATHANAHAPGFTEQAAAFVVAYLTQHGPTAGETVTDACKASGLVPHDDRAFGPVYMQLARRGVICKAGFCVRKKGNLTSGGNIWALTDRSQR